VQKVLRTENRMNEVTEMKVCIKCGLEKMLDEFYKDAGKKDGRMNICIACQAQYRQDHREEALQYHRGRKDKAAQYKAQYRQEHKEEIAQHKAEYYREHREELLQRGAQYYQKTREKTAQLYAEFSKQVVLHMGGRCECCGLITNQYEIYHCHHKDSLEKNFKIAGMIRLDWEKVVLEMQKCVLLCRECHNVLTQQLARSKPNRSSKAIYKSNRKDEQKWQCVEYLGSHCQICGRIHVDLPKYEFHHVCPTEKDFCISENLLMRWELLRLELDKCALLCGNCHASFHFGRYRDLILIPGRRIDEGSKRVGF
jgi:hypothetical protein